MYNIDADTEERLSMCSCCGGITHLTHAFVWRDGRPAAVYYLVWAEHLSGPVEEPLLFLTVSMGDFHLPGELRRAFAVVAAHDPYAGYRMGLCDDHPLEDEQRLGRPLTRTQALAQPDVDELWDLLDFAFDADPRIEAALTTVAA